MAPVVLGEGCVVFERAKVGVGMGDEEGKRGSMAPPPARSSAHMRVESMRSEGTVLGRNVVVDSGAVVEAAEVGEGSVIEVGAVVGRGTIIGKVCSRTCSIFAFGTCVRGVVGKLIINSSAPLRLPRSFLRIHACRITLSSLGGTNVVLIRRCSYGLRYWM